MTGLAMLSIAWHTTAKGASANFALAPLSFNSFKQHQLKVVAAIFMAS